VDVQPHAGHCAAQAQGRAVQVDPIKPKLKAPRMKRLKLQYDILLSNFAFKINLRHYSKGGVLTSVAAQKVCLFGGDDSGVNVLTTGSEGWAWDTTTTEGQPAARREHGQTVGPGGLCSPRHRLQLDSGNEGLKYG